MENLEVLAATNKQSSTVPRIMTRIGQKIRLENLKTRLKNFTRRILSPQGRKERSMTLTLMITGAMRPVQSTMPNVDYSGLTMLKTAEFSRNSGKKRNRATQGMTKKEFHTLVNTQMMRFIKRKNKDDRA